VNPINLFEENMIQKFEEDVHHDVKWKGIMKGGKSWEIAKDRVRVRFELWRKYFNQKLSSKIFMEQFDDSNQSVMSQAFESLTASARAQTSHSIVGLRQDSRSSNIQAYQEPRF
jgi:hypothetical protein